MQPFKKGYIRTMKLAGIPASAGDALDFAGKALGSPRLADAGAVISAGGAGSFLADPKTWTSSPVDRVYYNFSDTDEEQTRKGGLIGAGLGLAAMFHPRSRAYLSDTLGSLENAVW